MSQPPRITAIKPSARHPDRAAIHVAGRAVATLPTRLIADLGLQCDQPWTDSLARQVEQASQVDQAMRRAINRLNRRALSRRDLDRKLKQLDFDQPIREKVLDRLTELNYLDDRALGRALIRDIMLRKPAGPRLLRQKLFQKGLDADLIDQLIDETTQDTDAVDQCRQLARTRLAGMSRLDTAARQRRLWGLLARRGYESDTINQAMQSLAREIHHGADPDDQTAD